LTKGLRQEDWLKTKNLYDEKLWEEYQSRLKPVNEEYYARKEALAKEYEAKRIPLYHEYLDKVRELKK
jgi:hypothetical protein